MTASRRILYLEDEIIIALDTAQTLRELGFAQVDIAHNLRRARAFVARGAYEFALLDVNLGTGELSIPFGRELIAGGTRVLFATGYNRVEMEQEHGDLLFIEKPLSAGVIADALRRTLLSRAEPDAED